MRRISVDFNTINKDERERVLINTVVDKELLSFLRPGLRVVLYEDRDIEVEAVVEFDEEKQKWYGVPDWSTRRELPDLPSP